MRTRRTLAALCMALMLMSTGAIETGCRHTPPTVVTPQGQVAYQLEDVVDVVNGLQTAAIKANREGRLATDTTRAVVRYRRAAVSVVDQAIDAGTGRQAALRNVSNGLAEVEKLLTGPERDTLRLAISSIRTVLAALGGGQ